MSYLRRITASKTYTDPPANHPSDATRAIASACPVRCRSGCENTGTNGSAAITHTRMEMTRAGFERCFRIAIRTPPGSAFLSLVKRNSRKWARFAIPIAAQNRKIRKNQACRDWSALMRASLLESAAHGPPESSRLARHLYSIYGDLIQAANSSSWNSGPASQLRVHPRARLALRQGRAPRQPHRPPAPHLRKHPRQEGVARQRRRSRSALPRHRWL